MGYSDEGAQLVRRCTRLIKKSHTFFWAATPTCSNGLEGSKDEDPDAIDDRAIRRGADPIGPLLLSAEGLEQLVQAGELTAKERQALLESGLPPSQYAFILLQWVGLYAMGGLKAGTLRGSNGFEENLLRQLTGLRAEYFNVGDYAAGRMPLAYVQRVQVLSTRSSSSRPSRSARARLAIPATSLLTLFFKGLLELSKSFLDPFGNEAAGQNIRVDVLVSELNFGASSRWAKAGAGSRTRRARRRRRRPCPWDSSDGGCIGRPLRCKLSIEYPPHRENFLCLSGSTDPTIALLEAPEAVLQPLCCAGAPPMAASSRKAIRPTRGAVAAADRLPRIGEAEAAEPGPLILGSVVEEQRHHLRQPARRGNDERR